VGPFVQHPEIVAVVEGHTILVPVEVAEMQIRWPQLRSALENGPPVYAACSILESRLAQTLLQVQKAGDL